MMFSPSMDSNLNSGSKRQSELSGKIFTKQNSIGQTGSPFNGTPNNGTQPKNEELLVNQLISQSIAMASLSKVPFSQQTAGGAGREGVVLNEVPVEMSLAASQSISFTPASITAPNVQPFSLFKLPPSTTISILKHDPVPPPPPSSFKPPPVQISHSASESSGSPNNSPPPTSPIPTSPPPLSPEINLNVAKPKHKWLHEFDVLRRANTVVCGPNGLILDHQNMDRNVSPSYAVSPVNGGQYLGRSSYSQTPNQPKQIQQKSSKQAPFRSSNQLEAAPLLASTALSSTNSLMARPSSPRHNSSPASQPQTIPNDLLPNSSQTVFLVSGQRTSPTMCLDSSSSSVTPLSQKPSTPSVQTTSEALKSLFEKSPQFRNRDARSIVPLASPDSQLSPECHEMRFKTIFHKESTNMNQSLMLQQSTTQGINSVNSILSTNAEPARVKVYRRPDARSIVPSLSSSGKARFTDRHIPYKHNVNNFSSAVTLTSSKDAISSDPTTSTVIHSQMPLSTEDNSIPSPNASQANLNNGHSIEESEKKIILKFNISLSDPSKSTSTTNFLPRRSSLSGSISPVIQSNHNNNLDSAQSSSSTSLLGNGHVAPARSPLSRSSSHKQKKKRKRLSGKKKHRLLKSRESNVEMNQSIAKSTELESKLPILETVNFQEDEHSTVNSDDVENLHSPEAEAPMVVDDHAEGPFMDLNEDNAVEANLAHNDLQQSNHHHNEPFIETVECPYIPINEVIDLSSDDDDDDKPAESVTNEESDPHPANEETLNPIAFENISVEGDNAETFSTEEHSFNLLASIPGEEIIPGMKREEIEQSVQEAGEANLPLGHMVGSTGPPIRVVYAVEKATQTDESLVLISCSMLPPSNKEENPAERQHISLNPPPIKISEVPQCIHDSVPVTMETPEELPQFADSTTSDNETVTTAELIEYTQPATEPAKPICHTNELAVKRLQEVEEETAHVTRLSPSSSLDLTDDSALELHRAKIIKTDSETQKIPPASHSPKQGPTSSGSILKEPNKHHLITYSSQPFTYSSQPFERSSVDVSVEEPPENRKRGRPRKYPRPDPSVYSAPKKPRGRPRKIPLVVPNSLMTAPAPVVQPEIPQIVQPVIEPVDQPIVQPSTNQSAMINSEVTVSKSGRQIKTPGRFIGEFGMSHDTNFVLI